MSRLLPAPWAAPYVPLVPVSGLTPLFDAAGAGAVATSSPVTFTDAVPVDTAASVIWVLYASTTATPTVSASIGSSSGTLVAMVGVTTATPFYYLAAYLVLNPPTGTPTTTFTSSALAACAMETMHYKYVSAALAAITLGNQSGQPSLSLSATILNVLYAQAFGYRAAATGNTFSGSSFIERFVLAATVGTNPPLLIGDLLGTGSAIVSSASRTDVTNPWGGVALPLLPPVVFPDNVGAGAISNSGTSLTYSLLAQLGTTIVAGVVYNTASRTVSATYNGVAMNQLSVVVPATTANPGVVLFYLIGAGTGSSANVVVTFSGTTTGIMSNAASYINAAVISSAVTATGSTGATLMSLTSVAPLNSLAIGLFGDWGSAALGNFLTWGQTERYTNNDATSHVGILIEDTPGTLTGPALTATGSNFWAGITAYLMPPICPDQIGAGVGFTTAVSPGYIHTALGDADAYLAVVTTGGETFVSATLGGFALTVVGQQYLNNSSTNGQLTLCRVAQVIPGPFSMVITKSGSAHPATAQSVSYLNVNSVGTPVYTFGATSPTQTTTLTGGQRILQVFGIQSHTFTAASGGAARFNVNNAGAAGLILMDAIATATLAATPSASDNWAGMSVILN